MIPSVLQGLRALVSTFHYVTVIVGALVQFSPGLLGVNLHMLKDKVPNGRVNYCQPALQFLL